MTLPRGSCASSLARAAAPLCCLLVLVSAAAAAPTAGAHKGKDDMDDTLKLLSQLAQTRKGLNSLQTLVGDIDEDLQREHKLANLAHKRKGLEILKRILGEMDADIIYEQKRMCVVNLGGHCATESAAAVADQWHYLNSPLSPGRKRRDTRLHRKLVQGKLFQ